MNTVALIILAYLCLIGVVCGLAMDAQVAAICFGLAALIAWAWLIEEGSAP